MKKIISLLLVLIMTLGITACGAKKDQVTVCTGNSNGVEVTNTITHDGKEVYKQQIIMKSDLTGYGISEDDLKELIKEFETVYDIKGVEYTYDYKDSILTETINVDYKTADFKELQTAELIESSTTDVAYIGYDETIEGIEGEGLTCTLQK